MAKKNVSLFVSAAGWIAGLVEKLINILREKGVTDEEIHGLVTKNGDTLIGVIADAIVVFIKQTKRIVYTIVVDYLTSIEEMVRLGKYDWASGDINTKNFPTTRTGKAEIKVELFHFNCGISSRDAITEMDKSGYRPAELHELLAFGAKYPDVHCEFPIIALGSIWRGSSGGRYVAFLSGSGLGRFLFFGSFGLDWFDDCRFAAVRK